MRARRGCPPYDLNNRMLSAYRVIEVRTADGASLAPPEISERFEGRQFTLHELEQRGVRIAGANVWYLSSGQDWQLKLEPAV
jgi:hypothetical protein